jgi:hypothetical protein
VAAGKSRQDFATQFLDSELIVKDKRYSLKKYLWDKFVAPLSQEDRRVTDGHKLDKNTPRSAIFFGPPGTSKTELARFIADFLGWPLVAIDPSHLLRHGMDGIQAEANAIFRMLRETERVVVLFDEFDELVRERGSADAQPFSRLLTTAMLPKLASIHKGATLVFIATNNVQEFDLAIRREGRFDRILQVMPPTCNAKMCKKDWGPSRNVDFKYMFNRLKVSIDANLIEQLSALTFGECQAFAAELAEINNGRAATELLSDFYQRCTLLSPVSKDDDAITWQDRCKLDQKLSR